MRTGVARLGAVVLGMVLLLGGCGAGSKPHLSIYPDAEAIDAFGPASVDGLHPGGHYEWRVLVYNLGRNAITLDRVELAVSKGVTLHDAWTLDPVATRNDHSSWADERPGWAHEAGARPFAGTIVTPVDQRHRLSTGRVNVNVDVTMGGLDGQMQHMDGLRVWEHEGGHHFVVVLPMGVTACFAPIVRGTVCPTRSASATVAVLGL